MLKSATNGPELEKDGVVRLERTIAALLTYMSTFKQAAKKEAAFEESLNSATLQLHFGAAVGELRMNAQVAPSKNKRAAGADGKRKIGDTVSPITSVACTSANEEVGGLAKKRKSGLPQHASDFLIQWYVSQRGVHTVPCRRDIPQGATLQAPCIRPAHRVGQTRHCAVASGFDIVPWRYRIEQVP